MADPTRYLGTTGSGALHKLDEFVPASRKGHEWQEDAVLYNLLIPEVGSLHALTAELVSACLFRVVRDDPELGEVDPEGAAVAATRRLMKAFIGPMGGQKEVFRRAALLYQVAGEAILVGTALKDDAGIKQGLSWEILSTQEIKFEHKQVRDDVTGETKTKTVAKRNKSGTGTGQDDGYIEIEAYSARFWRSSLSFSEQADSPMRRVLGLCRQLVVLQEVVEGVARSHLSAGLLLIPDEITFGPDEEIDDDDAAGSAEDDHVDVFIKTLVEHMRTPVEDRTSASGLVPLVVTGPAEYLKEIRLVDLGQKLDEAYSAMRQELLGRIAQGLDAPPEVIKGKACLSEDSEILTRHGWKGIDELRKNDEVLSLDHPTGLSEWTTVTDVHRYDVIDEPMLSIDLLNHHSLTTMDHRWPVERVLCGDCGERRAVARGRCERCRKRIWRKAGVSPEATDPIIQRRWLTSAELSPADRLILGAPVKEAPQAKWDDSLVETAAWAATDGDITTWGRCRIRQSPTANPEAVSRICAATKGFDPSTRITHDPAVGCDVFTLSKESTEVLMNLGRLQGHRLVLDSSFATQLTRAQLALFLETGKSANGHKQGATISMFARDPDRLDVFEMAAILSGYRVSRTVHHQSEEAFSQGELCRLSWGPKTRIQARGATTNYTGRVWCPSVSSNSSYLARRNDCAFYTGNSLNHWSSYSVDIDFIDKYVTPVSEALANFITVAYLRPFLEREESFSPDEAVLYKIIADTRPLATQVDQGKTVMAAWDRIITDDNSALRASGLSEEDYPDPEERKRRFLEKMAIADPARLGAAILPILFPELADALGGLDSPDLDRVRPDGKRPGEIPDRSPAAGPPEQGPPKERPVGTPPSPAASVDALTNQITVAADVALTETMEITSARLLASAEAHPEIQKRLSVAIPGMELATLGMDDLQTLGIRLDDLTYDAWDSFTEICTEWITDFLAMKVQRIAAYSVAQSVTEDIVRSLDKLLVQSVGRGLPVGPDGHHVSSDDIRQSLELALAALP